MANKGMEVKGLSGVQKMFLRVNKAFGSNQKADKTMNRIALRTEREAKVQAPVVEGRLRSSMWSKLMGFTKGTFVSTNTDYAIFPHIKGKKPKYMEKAVEQAGGDIDKEINKFLDNIF